MGCSYVNWSTVNIRAICRIAIVLSFACLMTAQDVQASELYQLSLSCIKLDNTERISSFEITIKAGRIMSLPQLPMGWDLIIKNDPSWMTSVRGDALVGAAFLGNSDQLILDNLLIIEQLSDDIISKEVPFDVKAHISIINIVNEQERIVSVTKDMLGLRKFLQ